MVANCRVTDSSNDGAFLQIPAQPDHQLHHLHLHHRQRQGHLDHPGHPEHPARLPIPSPIVNPSRSRSGAVDGGSQEAPKAPRACSSSSSSSSSPAGPLRPCWDLDMRVAVLLGTVAGVIILLLLYRLLQLRHRLRTARGVPALVYYRFYHAASYTLKSPGVVSPAPTPGQNGNVLEASAAIQTGPLTTPKSSAFVDPPPPPPPLPPASTTPPPPPPPPPLHPSPPSPAPAPVLLRTPPTPPPPLLLRPTKSLPQPPTLPFLALPVGHGQGRAHGHTHYSTPPSPHLSWGGASSSSDVVEVYSRIGAFRPSRLSSLSSPTSQVVLFEHSSL